MKASVYLFLFLFSITVTANTREPNFQIYKPTLFGSSTLKALKVVHISTSAWSLANVQAELNKLNYIYSKCNLEFETVEILQLHDYVTNFDTNNIANLSSYLQNINFRKAREPLVVFASGVSGNLTILGRNLGGFAFNSMLHTNFSEEHRDAYENIAFILEISNTDAYKKERREDYSTAAHELGHIFLNMDHLDPYSLEGYNLMAGAKNKVSSYLSPDQCNRLQQSPLLYP